MSALHSPAIGVQTFFRHSVLAQVRSAAAYARGQLCRAGASHLQATQHRLFWQVYLMALFPMMTSTYLSERASKEPANI